MIKWKERRELMNEALKGIAVPVLREQGFKGTFPHFRKIAGEVAILLQNIESEWVQSMEEWRS
jgi:hypothetical protein